MADVKALMAQAEERRRALRAQTARMRAELPLKFWQQQAHFTTPASDQAMAQKAIEGGFASAPRILDRFQITLSDLAEKLELPVEEMEALLAADTSAPFVMVDGEDAQALREDVVQRGRENAYRLFREASWTRTLRFYRPSGLGLPYCAGDLVGVLMRVGEALAPSQYPLDGIVFPKVEQPEELDWVCQTLSSVERELGLQENQIRLEFLVESGWALANLPELVRRTLPRLAGIIWGIADYSADIGLAQIRNEHPVADWARMEIVNMAGAAGVPAIDNMTINYPVADRRLGQAENRQLILNRLKECYDDACHGIELGMDGKWVGHPLQLFVVMLAYRRVLGTDEVEREVAKIEAYRQAVEAELGATIIEGVMSDRATDRHARAKLRKAVALGRLARERALKLGVITVAEATQVAPADSRAAGLPA